VQLFQAACDKELATACGDLYWLYARGEHLVKDPARAAQLRQRACSLGEEDLCADK
jgi:TPR repeat protein